MYFEYPKLLWLLVIPVLLLGWYLWQELSGRRPHLRVPTATPWTLTGTSPWPCCATFPSCCAWPPCP